MYLQSSLPEYLATAKGEKRMLNVWEAPGPSTPALGSTLKGGNSGSPRRRRARPARALEGRAVDTATPPGVTGLEPGVTAAATKRRACFKTWAM